MVLNEGQSSFDNFIKACYLFNELAGKADKVSSGDIQRQLNLVHEEIQETQEALLRNDAVEFLDGVIDTMVTCAGLLQKLEALGINVRKAMQDTVNNNLSKYPSDPDTANATIEMYKSEGILTRIEYNERHQRFIILDSNDKVRKPVGYSSNKLSDCVPLALIEKGFSNV
jgi:hypothetical protein